jgi:uncharacterized repeat protein (TIGR03803 family)
MRNTPQHRNWTSSPRLAGASAVLIFAIILVPAVIAPQSAQAQTFTVLHSFDGTDGYAPESSLVQGTDGNLYGTTGVGGANDDCSFYNATTGCGTVFKITPGGTLTTLYSFCAQSGCTDGENPYGGLVLANNGDFYGTTGGGGAHGAGTVFKITSSGELTTVYNFCLQSGCSDGQDPTGTLVQATNGNFYGVTFFGGAHGQGAIFKLTPSGTLTTLYSFCAVSGCPDGQAPMGLIQASNGDFYGTTSDGGANNDGTVFRITSSGTLTTLHSFDYTDGKNPNTGMMQASNGDFYGTTFYGGAYNSPYGYGTVFKMTASGTLTSLVSFDFANGIWPTAGLVQATDGNLYGETQEGGDIGVFGTIFKITPSTGALTTLYTFCELSDCADGYGPLAAPLQDTDGTFYGTTWLGGASSTCSGCEPGGGYGTVFSLSTGLGPFVKTQTSSGKVGAAVKILGTNLTGSTAVMFNGTAAVFKVASSSLINATVPAGATTGFVTVVTRSGTLKSNKKFSVTP